MGDVAKGIKCFKKGMQDDWPGGKKPGESRSAHISGDHQVSAPVAQPAHPLDNAT